MVDDLEQDIYPIKQLKKKRVHATIYNELRIIEF
jgi:hypothetical protein